MVPFVPLDNAEGIRRIQRRTIKRCFDFASTQLKLLLLSGVQTLREAFCKGGEEEVEGGGVALPSVPDLGSKKRKERTSEREAV